MRKLAGLVAVLTLIGCDDGGGADADAGARDAAAELPDMGPPDAAIDAYVNRFNLRCPPAVPLEATYEVERPGAPYSGPVEVTTAEAGGRRTWTLAWEQEGMPRTLGISHPADAPAAAAEGPAWLEAGVRETGPETFETAVVLRREQGGLRHFAHIDGGVQWIQISPLWADDLHIEVNRACPTREDGCVRIIDHEVLFIGGTQNQMLSVLTGEDVRLILGGRPYEVRDLIAQQYGDPPEGCVETETPARVRFALVPAGAAVVDEPGSGLAD